MPGKVGGGLRSSGENNVTLPMGNFTRDDPFSVAFWMKTPDVKDRAVVFHRSQAWTDAGSRGYQLLIEDGKLSAALVHFWPGNAIGIRTVEPVPVGVGPRRVHLRRVEPGRGDRALRRRPAGRRRRRSATT